MHGGATLGAGERASALVVRDQRGILPGVNVETDQLIAPVGTARDVHALSANANIPAAEARFAGHDAAKEQHAVDVGRKVADLDRNGDVELRGIGGGRHPRQHQHHQQQGQFRFGHFHDHFLVSAVGFVQFNAPVPVTVRPSVLNVFGEKGARSASAPVPVTVISVVVKLRGLNGPRDDSAPVPVTVSGRLVKVAGPVLPAGFTEGVGVAGLGAGLGAGAGARAGASMGRGVICVMILGGAVTMPALHCRSSPAPRYFLAWPNAVIRPTCNARSRQDFTDGVAHGPEAVHRLPAHFHWMPPAATGPCLWAVVLVCAE